MDKNKTIKVRNLSSGYVSYILENRHIRREWNSKNQIRIIPAEELEEALYEKKIKNLFTLGYLGIDNKEDRILVKLEPEECSKEEVVEPFDSNKAKILLLAEKDLNKFKEKVESLQSGEIDTLVTTANEVKNIDYNKLKIIKEVLGVDISKQLINNAED